MKANTIGEIISKLRKESGMTQEELGKAADVSTQAVSRWERGGFPDITLLPKIADIFGVSIDALFGHSYTEKQDIKDLLRQSILQAEPENRLEYAYHLAWHIIKSTCASLDPSGDSIFRYMTDGENVERKAADSPESVPSLNYISDNTGLMHASVARDFHYALIMPEPEEGFSSIMKYPEEYRRFFAFLAKPHAVELMAFMYMLKPARHFTAALAAAQLNIPEEDAEHILRQMYELRLVQDICAQTPDGDLHVYCRMEDNAFIPFLYMATEVMRPQDIVCLYTLRQIPLLNAPLGTGCPSPYWRTRDKAGETLNFPSSHKGNVSVD